ncbi:MAG: epimerase [Chromatiales bacterium 21-64-14]|nr:MAG: epimerase [Chromatiales bacterium 21-64-14]HQU17074.1 complex I NDUFA9 subunit family protein [Gammaproteobacteria bacterium]
MKFKRIGLLGGTGFVGRHLAARLVEKGYHVRVLSRDPERHRGLKVLPTLELMAADVRDPTALCRGFVGCDAAINLVGILNEGRRGRGFQAVHVDLPRKVLDACGAAGVRRLLHMSALNADPSRGPSHYLRSKGEGEDLTHLAAGQGLQVTSFRPSVIFGPDDGFLNRFAALLEWAPGVFPLACPNARFAPVYIGDVVDAMTIALEDRASVGRRYELCGPHGYTLHQLVAYVARLRGLRRRVVDLGDWPSRLQARVLERMPGKPFSYDNYLSLQADSVCREDGLASLGIEPTPLEAVAPAYLRRHVAAR